MTLYSTQTLEKIAEADCVDRLFREECLRGKLATAEKQLKQAIKTGIVFDSLSLSGFGFSLYGFVDQLPDFSLAYLALASLTGVITGAGVYTVASMMGERENRKMRFKNLDLENGDEGFYIIDGKISSKATILEKSFGEKITSLYSLEQITNTKEKDVKYGFIDYLTVKNVSMYERRVSSGGVFNGEKTVYLSGSSKEDTVYGMKFEIRRFHEAMTLDYYDTEPPADLIRVSRNKKKFALLFAFPTCKNTKKDINLSCIKVYFPHP